MWVVPLRLDPRSKEVLMEARKNFIGRTKLGCDREDRFISIIACNDAEALQASNTSPLVHNYVKRP